MNGYVPLALAGLLAAAGCTPPLAEAPISEVRRPAVQRPLPSYDVPDRLAANEHRIRERLAWRFQTAGVDFPPDRVMLLALKQERTLELWGQSTDQPWRRVHDYPFTATSGREGPKLRQGDGQIPEGIYRISYLNPESRFHVSMKLDYPNDFDRAMGRDNQRYALGDNIFIHGGDQSIGCIAVGDPSVEELFLLTSMIGKEQVAVVIAPKDFRLDGRDPWLPHLPWTAQLYDSIRERMGPLRREEVTVQSRPAPAERPGCLFGNCGEDEP